ncbi:MAG: sigma-70 family RNA polymerase sigma factor [Phycisphaerales bacterium]|nr:sigma-70 family RNA polymerase sigma factor [Phycisphaerales bacterium]
MLTETAESRLAGPLALDVTPDDAPTLAPSPSPPRPTPASAVPAPVADPPLLPLANSPGTDSSTLRLTRAMARGDSDAVSTFYEANFERALAIARSATGRDESFCLDVVQDAMVKIARCTKPISDYATLMCWMARVVRTSALDTLRREARRSRRERAHASTHPALSTINLVPSDRAELLARTLDQITPDDRALLGLRFIDDRTLEHVAAAVGSTGPAVHGRIRRLLARLRAAAHGDTP